MSATITNKTKMVRKFSLAIACAAAVFGSSPAAKAEPEVKVDWAKALVEVDRLVRNGGEMTIEKPSPTGLHRSDRAQDDPFVQNGGNAWAGVTPRVALVARDWATHYRLAGDRLSLADAMRLSQSTRMVIGRIRFGDGRVRPFVQLGLGQWRTDRNLLPFTPRQTELAGQAGGGVEFILTRKWQLALESSTTALYREVRESEELPQMRLWSTTLASRIEF